MSCDLLLKSLQLFLGIGKWGNQKKQHIRHAGSSPASSKMNLPQATLNIANQYTN
jgi:hypothetical protein